MNSPYDVNKVSSRQVIGIAGVSSSVAVFGHNFEKARALTNVAKNGLETIPVIGTVVGASALLYDGYGAYQDYQKCMAGQ